MTKVAFQRDERRPILEVADDEGGAVRVLAAWAAPAKARSLLAPARNNVRGPTRRTASATPAYNAALLGDAALDRHLQLLHGACSEDAAIVDASVLLKARRRGSSHLVARDAVDATPSESRETRASIEHSHGRSARRRGSGPRTSFVGTTARAASWRAWSPTTVRLLQSRRIASMPLCRCFVIP